MIRFKWSSSLLIVALLAAQDGVHRIYSDVYYNEEGGDLLGTELELTTHGREVTGVLRIYQGGCATPSAVRGTLLHGKLHLVGDHAPSGGGKFEVDGIIQGEGLLLEKARLKRINKAHCQN